MTALLAALLLITNAAFGVGTDSPRSAMRPHPFEIDPEDEREILAFVGSLTPLPQVDVAHGLRDALKAVWRIYRPDLSEEDLRGRLRIYDGSRYAYKALRSTQPSRRIEYGRLRMTWLTFLRDLRPDEVPNARALEHRARALMVPQRAGSIIAFLTAETKITLAVEVAPVARALAILHREYLPETPPDEARATATDTWSRQDEIRRLWDAYLGHLTNYRARTLPPADPSRIRFKHKDEMPDDPFDVPLVPQWIVEYLALRYPYVKTTQPNALALYVDAFRLEHGLALKTMDLRPAEFSNVFHHDYYYSGVRTVEAWRTCLDDLAVARACEANLGQSSRPETTDVRPTANTASLAQDQR